MHDITDKVEELIEEFNGKGRYVAALIVEPIQAEGGQYYETHPIRRDTIIKCLVTSSSLLNAS